jgi:hypothetical protein
VDLPLAFTGAVHHITAVPLEDTADVASHPVVDPADLVHPDDSATDAPAVSLDETASAAAIEPTDNLQSFDNTATGTKCAVFCYSFFVQRRDEIRP